MTDTKQLLKRQKINSTESKALPMPIMTKKRIILAQDEAHEARSTYREYQDEVSLREMKHAISDFYNLVWIYLDDLSQDKKEDYKNLEKIKEARIEVRDQNKEFRMWSNWLYEMDKLLKDLGITAIGIKRRNYDFGYEIWNGLPFTGKKTSKFREWMNWYRLKANIYNYSLMLREDTDGLIVIWGPNRVGKTTLGLHLVDLVHPKKITKKNFVFDNDDFWDATDLPKYSSFLVDELSRLFYSKDTMTKTQKKRKKKLKTYAKKNMLVFGCDLNFYNLDKELISDKLTAAIKVTHRNQQGNYSRFEFYSKQKIQEFEKDRDTGEAITPDPDFTGRFPAKKDKVWKLYQEEENRKIEKKEDEEEDDKVDE